MKHKKIIEFYVPEWDEKNQRITLKRCVGRKDKKVRLLISYDLPEILLKRAYPIALSEENIKRAKELQIPDNFPGIDVTIARLPGSVIAFGKECEVRLSVQFMNKKYKEGDA